METNKEVSTAITPAQQAAITAIQNFFMHDGEWQAVETALAAAKSDAYTETPLVPKNSRSWHLDTIVRDSYFDLRQIGLDDEAAWLAVKDC